MHKEQAEAALVPWTDAHRKVNDLQDNPALVPNSTAGGMSGCAYFNGYHTKESEASIWMWLASLEFRGFKHVLQLSQPVAFGQL